MYILINEMRLELVIDAVLVGFGGKLLVHRSSSLAFRVLGRSSFFSTRGFAKRRFPYLIYLTTAGQRGQGWIARPPLLEKDLYGVPTGRYGEA